MDEYIENLRQRLLDMRDRANADKARGRPRTRADAPAVINHRRRERVRYWGGDPVALWSRFAIAKLRTRAKQHGMTCEATRHELVELLDQCGMRCPVFDMALRLGHGLGRGHHGDFASIDRIDRTKGFDKGNLIIMSALAKQAIGMLTDQQMLQLGDHARAVTVLRKVHTITDKSPKPVVHGWDDEELETFLYRKTP